MLSGYFFVWAESNSIREVCQGSERTLSEGAGTHRDSAGMEGWNLLKHCGRRPQPKEFQKVSTQQSPEGSLLEA